MAKLGKHHIIGLLGLSNTTDNTILAQPNLFEEKYVVADHQLPTEDKVPKDDDDELSCSSSESDKNTPPDDHVMHIVGRLDNGVRCVTVQEEELVWDAELLL
jgi:hypothetical protein